MVVIEVACLMEGNGHVKEMASLMEGERFCYKGGLFNGGGMVMLERWTYVYFIVFYGQSWSFVSCIQYILPLNLLTFLFLFFNVFLHTAEFLHTGEREDFMPAKIVQVCQSRRENDHVMVSLMEGEWSCYGGGQFNGERMVMLQKWSV